MRVHVESLICKVPNYATDDDGQVMLVDNAYGTSGHPDMTLTAFQTTFQDILAESMPYF